MPSGYEDSDDYAGPMPRPVSIAITIVAVLAIAGALGWLVAGRPASAASGTVCVKYGPCPLDLSSFACTDTQGNNVRRVCYDEGTQFMVIKLKETWYPYCAIDAGTVTDLLQAPSVGSYFATHIRSAANGDHGPFDCRDHSMPDY